MKTSIQLLDCTLRDGGYLVDTMFGETFVKGFTRSMTDAGLNVVAVCTVLDRGEGGREAIEAAGYQLRALFTRPELVELAKED